MEDFKLTTGHGIAFILGLIGGAVGARKIPAYLERIDERKGKAMASYMLQELKEAGLLKYAPEQKNPQTLDSERIYKALDDLTVKVSDLEGKIKVLG